MVSARVGLRCEWRAGRCQRGAVDSFDRRYVVVDEASGEVVDNAHGYGYTSAQTRIVRMHTS